MEPVTIQQAEILWHTLGLNPSRRESSRNHYVAGPGHYAMPDLEALESSGLMRRTRTPAFLDQDDVVFAVTDKGKEIAVACLPPPPKRTRYEGYQDADTGYDFADYLGINLPRYEWRSSRGRPGRFEYRMARPDRRYAWGDWGGVTGDWAPTKKAAKASYKAALAAHRAKKSGSAVRGIGAAGLEIPR